MKKTITIKGMHCPNCTKRVEKAIIALGADVSIDLNLGIATVSGDNISEDILKETIEDLGFEVVEIK